MKNKEFYVSVIVPVYNGEKFLAEAIQNIQNQKYQPLEIIVIDDESTDNTAEIAAQFKDKIRYIYQNNSGPSAARNQGIKIARGNIIAFLDVDDLWSDNALKLQLECLDANPSIEIIQGLIQEMHLDSSITDKDKLIFKPYSKPYYSVNLGSGIYRMSVFDKVGLFNEKFSDNEDTEWFFRAWKNDIYKYFFNQVTLLYRKHNTNISLKQINPADLGLLKILRTEISLYRQQGNSTNQQFLNLDKFFQYVGLSPVKSDS
ncbi:glycosyltransferase family 2 protein [Nostoc sp. C117]|uniref:glycosyltransferase family 2 protein n=1 Tax=Nostoc sp. C117 TaxID=3349875 RepID=UPI00370D5FD0